MPEMTTASLLMRRLRGLPADTERDLADCGTAFGLDLSLARAQDAKGDGEPAARQGGWWRRMAGRGTPPQP